MGKTFPVPKWGWRGLMIGAMVERDAHVVGTVHIDVHVHLCLLDGATEKWTVDESESMR